MQDILDLIPKDISLKEVAKMAALLKEKQAYLENLEQMIKDLKTEIKDIAEDIIPTMMSQAGLSEYKLDDGSKVTVKENVYAHISAKNKPDAFDWLRKQGLDDIIKNEIVATFGRGEDTKAVDLYNYLTQAAKLNAVQKQTVHPSTLKAFAKEQVESGNPDFPQELFGVHVVREASVK